MKSQVAEPDMAAKRRQAKPRRDDVAVKIDRTLADKARFAASRRGITLAEYLTGLLRQSVERDFAKALREMEGTEE
jgi:hypothetical protein